MSSKTNLIVQDCCFAHVVGVLLCGVSIGGAGLGHYCEEGRRGRIWQDSQQSLEVANCFLKNSKSDHLVLNGIYCVWSI